MLGQKTFLRWVLANVAEDRTFITSEAVIRRIKFLMSYRSGKKPYTHNEKSVKCRKHPDIQNFAGRRRSPIFI
jgi:hypothetical protein